jgi:hypothetical protein
MHQIALLRLGGLDDARADDGTRPRNWRQGGRSPPGQHTSRGIKAGPPIHRAARRLLVHAADRKRVFRANGADARRGGDAAVHEFGELRVSCDLGKEACSFGERRSGVTAALAAYSVPATSRKRVAGLFPPPRPRVETGVGLAGGEIGDSRRVVSGACSAPQLLV